jgi:hypothetical protein
MYKGVFAITAIDVNVSGWVSISSASLKNMISKTIFAISRQESRYPLNGALLVLKAESMAMGRRLAHVETSTSPTTTRPLLSSRQPRAHLLFKAGGVTAPGETATLTITVLALSSPPAPPSPPKSKSPAP